jgi:hypothetical protein
VKEAQKGPHRIELPCKGYGAHSPAQPEGESVEFEKPDGATGSLSKSQKLQEFQSGVLILSQRRRRQPRMASTIFNKLTDKPVRNRRRRDNGLPDRNIETTCG